MACVPNPPRSHLSMCSETNTLQHNQTKTLQTQCEPNPYSQERSLYGSCYLFCRLYLCSGLGSVFNVADGRGPLMELVYKSGGSWWLMVLFAKKKCDFRGGARGPSATSSQRNSKQTNTLQNTVVCHPKQSTHVTNKGLPPQHRPTPQNYLSTDLPTTVIRVHG